LTAEYGEDDIGVGTMESVKDKAMEFLLSE
jgi:hypothetical protein